VTPERDINEWARALTSLEPPPNAAELRRNTIGSRPVASVTLDPAADDDETAPDVVSAAAGAEGDDDETAPGVVSAAGAEGDDDETAPGVVSAAGAEGDDDETAPAVVPAASEADEGAVGDDGATRPVRAVRIIEPCWRVLPDTCAHAGALCSSKAVRCTPGQ
jgi:hypothetical protein